MKEEILRRQLVQLLTGADAHLRFDRAVRGVPHDQLGVRPEGIPHSIWELVEHMRIAQWDILEFSINPDHVSPEFPSGYWPKPGASPSEAEWNRSLAAFGSDLERMLALIQAPGTDLFGPIPHGNGQTILREALLVADHNAYHLGQIVDVRRLLGLWPPGRA